ncbi:MAG: Fe-S cluster assembly protein SufD [Pseudomonadota bacterium]
MQAAGLSPARAKAFEAFAMVGMPHQRMEAWKWTDLRAALRDELPSSAGNDVITPSIFANVGPFEITVMNGAAEWRAAPAGIAIKKADTPLSALAADHPLANLCAAFARETLAIDIVGAVTQPILIRRIAGAGSVHARARISLAAGADATVIESFDGAGDCFSNSVTEFSLGDGAKLHRIVLQNAGEAGVETALATATLAKGAVFDQTALIFGGKAVRIETRITHAGEGARAMLKSASALCASRHADVTSLVRHEARGCETRQTHKAALRDKSHGVFQGKFHVARGAQRTDAEMRAGALLLSELAEADSKPELEIYADDVKCSHGSTAGALDENAIFYMRQRGLSESAARAFLIEAFLGEVFDGAPHANLEHVMRARLSRWLEAS